MAGVVSKPPDLEEINAYVNYTLTDSDNVGSLSMLLVALVKACYGYFARQCIKIF